MPADAMDTLEDLLAGRWSCRGFRPDPVPEEVLTRLLAAAAKTPSWCNTQPWEVHVLSGAAARRLSARLLATATGAEDPDDPDDPVDPVDVAASARTGPDLPFPTGYTGPRLDRRRECGWQLYDAVGVERGDREASAREGLRNLELFGAPHVAVVTSHAELGPYGAVDCGLYVQTFLLAAQALGLGACAQAALAAFSPLLHEHLDLDEDRVVVCGISFGHPDPDHPSAGFRTRRAPLTHTVRHHP